MKAFTTTSVDAAREGGFRRQYRTSNVFRALAAVLRRCIILKFSMSCRRLAEFAAAAKLVCVAPAL
jgi:hypothetical protein